jgi:hypothetical protein
MRDAQSRRAGPIVRILVAATAIITGVLGSCAARDPAVSSSDTAAAGNWKIERQIDRITGVPIASAMLSAPSSHTAEAFPKRALMQLTCFNKAPLVRFAFEVKVGTTRNAVLGYRFDERPGHEINGRFLDDDRVAVIEDGAEVAQFIDELSTAQLLYLRIRSLSFGRTTAEFRPNGAPAAIAAAFANCPVATRPKPH